MNEVKRYAMPIALGGRLVVPQEAEKGLWCIYQDYAKLESENNQLRTECDRLREALGDAARSLEGIRSHAGLDPYLETMQQVRGFAESRAIAAQAALTQRSEGDIDE